MLLKHVCRVKRFFYEVLLLHALLSIFETCCVFCVRCCDDEEEIILKLIFSKIQCLRVKIRALHAHPNQLHLLLTYIPQPSRIDLYGKHR